MNDVHAIDEKTLAAYLSEQIDSFEGPLSAESHPDNSSNLHTLLMVNSGYCKH